MLGMASPRLRDMLKTNQPVYIDGTFRCVPKNATGYNQLLVFMMYDAATSLYIPCVYVLVTSKKEWAYYEVFNRVISTLDLQWNPTSVVCDFEMSLINAVKCMLLRSRVSLSNSAIQRRPSYWMLFSLEAGDPSQNDCFEIRQRYHLTHHVAWLFGRNDACTQGSYHVGCDSVCQVTSRFSQSTRRKMERILEILCCDLAGTILI